MAPHIENQVFKDGDMVWKVARLMKLAEDLVPFKIPFKHFNINNLYPSKIGSTMGFVDQVKWVNEADLSYPIILDDEGYCMDGRHRVLKALLLGKKSILAVRFKDTPKPCYYEKD